MEGSPMNKKETGIALPTAPSAAASPSTAGFSMTGRVQHMQKVSNWGAMKAREQHDAHGATLHGKQLVLRQLLSTQALALVRNFHVKFRGRSNGLLLLLLLLLLFERRKRSLVAAAGTSAPSWSEGRVGR